MADVIQPCRRRDRAARRSRMQGEEVVVVSHGGAIRAAVAHALRIGPTTRCTCRCRTCR